MGRAEGTTPFPEGRPPWPRPRFVGEYRQAEKRSQGFSPKAMETMGPMGAGSCSGVGVVEGQFDCLALLRRNERGRPHKTVGQEGLAEASRISAPHFPAAHALSAQEGLIRWEGLQQNEHYSRGTPKNLARGERIIFRRRMSTFPGAHVSSKLMAICDGIVVKASTNRQACAKMKADRTPARKRKPIKTPNVASRPSSGVTIAFLSVSTLASCMIRPAADYSPALPSTLPLPGQRQKRFSLAAPPRAGYSQRHPDTSGRGAAGYPTGDGSRRRGRTTGKLLARASRRAEGCSWRGWQSWWPLRPSSWP
jgi:hypothetical protein